MVKVLAGEGEIDGIELLVFDKDGTLMDLYVYWSNMIRLRSELICSRFALDEDEHADGLMSAMGVDTSSGRLHPEGPAGLLPRSVVQKSAEGYLGTLGITDAHDVCAEIFKEVDKRSVPLLGHFIRPLKGAIELLKAVKDAGCATAIATTDRTERAILAIRHMGIPDLIDHVVGADQVEHSKPAPDMLELISSISGVPPERSVMIGDAITDVQTGINAGFKASVGVCSGLTARDVLSGLTPYVVEDISRVRLTKEEK